MRSALILLGEEGELGRGRFPATDRVLVRKPAQALDDLDIRLPVEAQGTGPIGIARQRFEQDSRAPLVVDILGLFRFGFRLARVARARRVLARSGLDRAAASGPARRVGED